MNEVSAARAAQLAEAARRTLKALAERRMVPTPETFADVYHELNGGEAASPLACLRAILRDLLRTSRISAAQAAPLLERARHRDWAVVNATLASALAHNAGAAGAGWPGTTLALLKGTDSPHANWTRGRKLDAATHVLEAAAHEPDVALERLRKLLDSWGAPLAAVAASAAPPVEPGVDAGAPGERQIDEERTVRAGLQRLLVLLCDNIETLSPDEAWLAGQLEPIRALLAGPMTAPQLADAEQQLAGVIERQRGGRRALAEEKRALKVMLSTLVGSIGTIGDSTGRFYERTGGYQKQLEAATDLATMSGVIAGLLADTGSMRSDIAASRSELESARRKVEVYETRLRELERELAQVCTLVQKDPLTQTLNRRGLDDAYRIECARAARYRTPLAVVMIDVDDFKALNDALGHAAGDRALVHLVQTLRASLRPTDQLARVGGEEFALLLPATGLDDSVQAMQRGLRALAASPLRFEGDEWVLRFSAGAVLWRSGESLDQILKRADEAMYAAKRAGKNTVMKGEQ